MRSEISTDRLSELIGAIYDCVIAPEKWSATIDAIRNEFQFANAMMSVNSLQTRRAVFHATARVDPAALARASEYGPEIIELWGVRSVSIDIRCASPSPCRRPMGR